MSKFFGLSGKNALLIPGKTEAYVAEIFAGWDKSITISRT